MNVKNIKGYDYTNLRRQLLLFLAIDRQANFVEGIIFTVNLFAESLIRGIQRIHRRFEMSTHVPAAHKRPLAVVFTGFEGIICTDRARIAKAAVEKERVTKIGAVKFHDISFCTPDRLAVSLGLFT